jgi:predicted RecB family nuclease
MIDNHAIESYLNCKHKAYLILMGHNGKINEYEKIQTLNREEQKQTFYRKIQERYGKENVIYDYHLDTITRNKFPKLLITFNLKIDSFKILIDGIHINSLKRERNKKTYTPLLYSENETFSKKDKLILTIQCILLSKLFGFPSEYGRIYYGSELRTIKFKMSNLIAKCQRILNDIEKLAKNEFEPTIFQNDHCKVCEFEDECHKKLIERDDLSLLSCIGEKEVVDYEKRGIFTIKQLSYTFKPRKNNMKIKSARHPYYASLQALAIRDKKVYVYDKICLPNVKIKVFVDFEGNSDGSFIYLIGILVVNNQNETNHRYWADDITKEKEIFSNFEMLLNTLDNPHIFCFGKYDIEVLIRVTDLYALPKTKELLEKGLTDILKEIRRKIYFPTYSNGLKDIGAFLGCKWSENISSGIKSIVWRWKWEHDKISKFKEDLLKYNYEDCLALKKVTVFLYEIQENIIRDKTTKMENVDLVTNLKIDDHKRIKFQEMEYVTKDIEIITKCAYFQYQRNKIYWRTNDTIRKIVKKKIKKKSVKVNKSFYLTQNYCPFCKSRDIWKNKDNVYRLNLVDLKICNSGIKKWVTQYRTNMLTCQSCRNEFIPRKFMRIKYYSRIEVSRKHIKHTQEGFGHSLLSWVVHQFLVNQTTFRNIEGNLRYYFKIPADHRQIWEMKVMGAKYYKKTYAEILKKLINSSFIHADESKVKLRINSGYIWVFTNMEEVYYMYKPNRESAFLENMMQNFRGILISDFYHGYDSLKCLKQKCLIHLIRDLNDALLKNLHDEEIKRIVIDFGKILREIIKSVDRFGLKKRFLKRHEKRVNRFFSELKKNDMNSELAEKLQKRLIKYKDELFTFIKYDNIPWNNNNVEYAIKTFKDYFRQIKGTITERGLESHLILLSIYQTCNYKGINFLDFLLSKEKDIDKFQSFSKR